MRVQLYVTPKKTAPFASSMTPLMPPDVPPSPTERKSEITLPPTSDWSEPTVFASRSNFLTPRTGTSRRRKTIPAPGISRPEPLAALMRHGASWTSSWKVTATAGDGTRLSVMIWEGLGVIRGLFFSGKQTYGAIHVTRGRPLEGFLSTRTGVRKARLNKSARKTSSAFP
jgi:hypothetical protein